MPGQMGNKRVTVQGLEIVSVDAEKVYWSSKARFQVLMVAMLSYVRQSKPSKGINVNLKTVTGVAVELSEITFGREFNEALVHQVVTAYLAGARQGTRAQNSWRSIRRW